MKQLILNPRTGKHETVDVPAPELVPGHVLVRVCASVVSPGTERTAVSFAEKSLVQKAYSRPDLVKQVFQKVQRDGLLTTVQAALNRLGQPMPLGYSCSGVVIGVGEGVGGFAIGDVVACAGGGYAAHCEIALVPENLCANLMPFCASPERPLIETAAFSALAGIALHGVRLAELKLGETAAVIGLGLIGQLTLQLLKAAGCVVVAMDIAPDRVELAKRLGADAVASSPEEMQTLVSRLSAGRGADAVLITAATQSDAPLHLAAELARDRAIVVPVGAVGLNVPRKIFYEKELDLRISRSYGPGRYDPEYEERGKDYPVGYVRWTENRNMLAFLQLAAQGKIDMEPLITHRFPIDDANRAYDILLGKTEERSLAILLVYPESGAADRSHRVVLPVRSTAGKLMSGRPVGIGMLGAGNFANATLLPVLKRMSDVQLVGVASARGLSSRHCADSFGFSYCTTSEDELLGDSNVDALFILTRHNLHANQLIRALNAGKHVFVEKPLALHPSEMAEIARAMHGHPEQRVIVGFNRRFAPLAREMKKFFTEVHEPLVLEYRVNAGYIPLAHWIHDPAQGGGRIIGEGCHFIDFANWMIGQIPVRVEATALPDNGRYNRDNAVIRLIYPDGSMGVVTYLANGDRSIAKERVEVHSAGHSAILDDYWRLELAKGGHTRSQRQRFRQDKGHRGECIEFIKSIREGTASPILPQELLAATAATFAAVESMDTGVAVEVDIPDVFTAPSLVPILV